MSILDSNLCLDLYAIIQNAVLFYRVTLFNFVELPAEPTIVSTIEPVTALLCVYPCLYIRPIKVQDHYFCLSVKIFTYFVY